MRVLPEKRWKAWVHYYVGEDCVRSRCLRRFFTQGGAKRHVDGLEADPEILVRRFQQAFQQPPIHFEFEAAPAAWVPESPEVLDVGDPA